LFTIALAKDANLGARVLTGILSVITSLMSIYLILSHRIHAEADTHPLSRGISLPVGWPEHLVCTIDVRRELTQSLTQNGGSAHGYLADLSRCQRSGHHGRARRDSDRALDIYAGHRVPGTRVHAAGGVTILSVAATMATMATMAAIGGP
jgi:hypothetical protein